MDKLRFIMLVGLPASGKSTYGKELSEGRGDILYLSSDELREELYNDVNHQGSNSKLFEEMNNRARQALKDGNHVIYDATNISRKKRRGLLRQLPKDIEKVAIYMATSYEEALYRNAERERHVPEDVISRMYKDLQIPVYSEGWDKIIIQFDEETENQELPKQFTDALRTGVLLNREGYQLMPELAQYFKEFFDIYDMPQDSKYHSLSVSRHTYYVYRYILENYSGGGYIYQIELMLWTALLHDTGKHFCKSFINRKGEETRYANFIGHENVSAQLAVRVLKTMGFGDEFIHQVATLIQFHMYLLDEKANRQKLIDYVGEENFKRLEILREADTQAH